MFTRASCQAASEFAKPYAIAGIPVLCVLWVLLGFDMVSLTLALSILAITMTQLVLVGQRRSEDAMKAWLKELLRAVPDADDTLADLDELD